MSPRLVAPLLRARPSRAPVAVALAASLLAGLPASAAAQVSPLREDQGSVGLGLALRRLNVTGRVLYVTAHPDDEGNGALVALARGRGLDVTLFTLTRGEGGQNAIGTELGEALGLLRSEELRAMHRYDGARQLFGAAYEFGFSFSLEETLARWGREETLGDVVRAVRRVRPDVMLTLPLDAGGHQHHTASARLAAEAFRAAADPSRFPESLAAGLRPWQPRALYIGGVGGGDPPPGGRALQLDLGEQDPLLGMSFAEYGALARGMHKCQAAVQTRLPPGERTRAAFVLVDSEPALADPDGLLSGIDVSLRGLARFAPVEHAAWIASELGRIEGEISRTAAAFDLRAPERVLPGLAAALQALRGLTADVASRLPDAARAELLERLAAEEQDLLAALALAQGVSLDVAAEDAEVVPGQAFGVSARVVNRGAEPLAIDEVTLRVPPGWSVTRNEPPAPVPDQLEPGAVAVFAFSLRVPTDAAPTRPYWRREPGRDRYEVTRPELAGLPFAPAEVAGRLRYRAAGVSAAVESPALLRYEGRWVGGEKEKTVGVVPALAVAVEPELLVVPLSPTGARRELRVRVRNNRREAASARVRLEAPAGWKVEPAVAELALQAEGEEAVARFRVTAPTALRAGEALLRASAESDGRVYLEGYQTIAYDHVEERRLFREARARVRATDVRTAPGASIGYVMGVGDQVPDAIRQLGLPVALLEAEDLAVGDLSRFTTIVLGVRAYHARADLRVHHARLMRWVEQGGHLVVMYARWEFHPSPDRPSPWAPYPARVTTARVTDETAPMQALAPASELLTRPNRIGPADWEGWVQERAIQALDAQDARYTDVLAAADPFPENAGEKKGLLVEARVGKGTWTYVGLALFRQLPAGVPGAYRLLANLLSRPARGR